MLNGSAVASNFVNPHYMVLHYATALKNALVKTHLSISACSMR